jgi:hypothetical protein
MLDPTPEPPVFTTKVLQLLPARSCKPSRDYSESQRNPLTAKKINQLSKAFSRHTNVIRPKKNDNSGAFLKFSCSFLQAPVQKMLDVKRYPTV